MAAKLTSHLDFIRSTPAGLLYLLDEHQERRLTQVLADVVYREGGYNGVCFTYQDRKIFDRLVAAEMGVDYTQFVMGQIDTHTEPWNSAYERVLAWVKTATMTKGELAFAQPVDTPEAVVEILSNLQRVAQSQGRRLVAMSSFAVWDGWLFESGLPMTEAGVRRRLKRIAEELHLHWILVGP